LKARCNEELDWLGRNLEPAATYPRSTRLVRETCGVAHCDGNANILSEAPPTFDRLQQNAREPSPPKALLSFANPTEDV